MAKKRSAAAKRKAEHGANPAMLAQRLKLRDLSLLKSACARGTDVRRVPELKQTVSVEITPKLDEPTGLVLRVDFALTGKTPEGQEGLNIAATFGILYGVDSIDDFAPETVATFMPSVGLGHAWPYWREFVQSMTTRMGLPPLRIPLLKPDELQGAPVSIETERQPKKGKIEKAK
jgi:preprotein translocase subunit SecB